MLDLYYNYSVVLIQWHVFYFHSLSDELEVAFLSLIVGVCHFPLLRKNFPQSHLIII